VKEVKEGKEGKEAKEGKESKDVKAPKETTGAKDGAADKTEPTAEALESKKAEAKDGTSTSPPDVEKAVVQEGKDAGDEADKGRSRAASKSFYDYGDGYDALKEAGVELSESTSGSESSSADEGGSKDSKDGIDKDKKEKDGNGHRRLHKSQGSTDSPKVSRDAGSGSPKAGSKRNSDAGKPDKKAVRGSDGNGKKDSKDSAKEAKAKPPVSAPQLQ